MRLAELIVSPGAVVAVSCAALQRDRLLILIAGLVAMFGRDKRSHVDRAFVVLGTVAEPKQADSEEIRKGCRSART
jgi:hypothetical protein